MRPKFEVGEVVVLQSVAKPELNGEYVVENVHFDNVITATHHVEFTGYLYGLEGLDCSVWIEPSLRKKHTPGEMTLDNLMASLSSPKLLTHQPQ